MQPQRKHARNSIVSNAISRRRLHDNIIQWRNQSAEPRQPEPANFCAAPGEDDSKPLVSRRVQNIILVLVGIAACLIARSEGAL